MTKRKIVVTTSSFARYSDQPIRMLEEAGFDCTLNPYERKLTTAETIDLLRDAVGVIAGTEAYSREVLDRLPSDFEVISRCGTGTDGIDFEAAARHGIAVLRTPGVPTPAVAELALAGIIATLRRLCVLDRQVRQGLWQEETGYLLRGKTVGVIGLGQIGKALVALLQPFEGRVLGYDVEVDETWVAAHNVTCCELDELLAGADVVSLHVPHTEATNGLLDHERLGRMKRGAVLVNTSRGGLVDEAALYRSLKEEHLGGAFVDTFEREPYDGPLRELANIILTPHVGSFTVETRTRMEYEAVENLLNHLRTGTNA